MLFPQQFSIYLSQLHQKWLILQQKYCARGELHQKMIILLQFEYFIGMKHSLGSISGDRTRTFVHACLRLFG